LASMAPCGTRPCSRKRHSAIANLRATATIMIRRIRPLCPAVRCTNQRVIALFGWCLSQSQWSRALGLAQLGRFLGIAPRRRCREDSLQDRESRPPAADCRIGDNRPRAS
jgi:hypothetical protein